MFSVKDLSEACGSSMSGSAALALGAVNSVLVGGTFGSQVGLCRRNSISFFDGNVTIAILHPSKRSPGFSADFCKYWTRQCGFACERRNGKDWWVRCRDARSPGQRRKSHALLALSTFLITQSSPDADETEKWRLEDDLLDLKELQGQLQPCKNLKEKIAVLDSNKRVLGLFRGVGRPGTYIKPSVALASRALSEFDIYILKCLVAVGQEHLLEWPSALRDAYAVPEKLKSKPVSGSAFGSIKEVFNRLGNVIESRSWEGPQRKFWQSLPVLLTHRDEKLQCLNTAGEVNSCEREVRGEDIETRLLESLKVLVAVLVRLEKFYDSIGGIIGYQVRALELIRESEIEKQQTDSSVNGSSSSSSSSPIQFSVPLGPDLSRDKAYAMEAASWGLEGLPLMGEIFPLGGAGDRLGLVDESTGESLPVAMLPYCGRTLLEGLIRDLQAREFLYFKVFGTQQITPVAIMTSAAKKNDERVYALFERHGWFGRGKGNFRLFEQPLVPTVAAADGHWLTMEPLKAVLKPGGHGVIWKLASDEGIFKWFYSKERKAALVRQISNPVAATDCTLLALSGIGLKQKKKFGFASCERNVGTAEGVNVLRENRLEDGSLEYAVTCIEYTDFNKMGILDVPVSPGSMQAQYPANTNVLYVDLPSVEHVASSQTSASLPGMIMNLKKPVEYDDQWGNKHSVRAGRLECTMQNVADAFMSKCTSKLSPSDQGKLDTYLIYNHRRKVTSSAKRRRKQGEHSLHQTPDGSFLDLTRNAFDLLTSCGVQIPQMEGNHCYIDDGPPFLTFLHPCLGPLWDVIRQKIKGGSLLSGSELQLEVAEFAWNNVQLDGSLFIHATNIMGSLEDSDKESVLQYGLRCGKCRLFDVHVKNKGVDWRCKSNVYWQNKIQRLECLEIFLEEDAEFEASSVTIKGAHKFFVPKGHRMIVTSTISGGMTSMVEALPTNSSTRHGSWVWNYKLEKSGELVLSMVDL